MVHHVVVVRVSSILSVFISIRSLVVAGTAVHIVHGRRNAGGRGLKARANGARNKDMSAYTRFRFVADGTAKPVLFGVPSYVRIRVPPKPRGEGMVAVVLPATGAACSQRNAGRAAVAGAASGVDRIAAFALAVADMLTVVALGLPRAPVVAQDVVFSAALGAGFARGAGRRFGAAGVKAEWIAKRYVFVLSTATRTVEKYPMAIVVVSLESFS